MLPDLDPDALYAFVFGPGYGEFVAVRAPPNDWLVVDGCSAAGRSYGKLLLDHYAARPRLIVLSHPHTDHARGMGEVIDDCTDGVPEEDWPAIGLVLPPWVQGAGDLGDMPSAFLGGGAEHAVAAILDRWERHPGSRWDLLRGEVRALGDACVEVVAPSPQRRAAVERSLLSGAGFNPNTIATVLLVEWASHRLVLGSDLTDAAPEGWSAALSHAPRLTAPSLLKVAHHGSLKAQEAALLTGAGETSVVCTPGPRRLPRFEDGEGAEWLLARVPEIHLTAMPRSYSEQGVHPQDATRRALLAAGRGHLRSPRVTGFPDCFVVVRLAPDGARSTLVGQGGLVVRP